MKTVSICGYHHTGKTTVAVAVMKELKKRGYRVASIKDIHYEQFSMEKVGSNSWKHLQANQEAVFARGEKETYQIWNKQLNLQEMMSNLSADYVIIEGMHEIAVPHIVCAENTDQIESLFDRTTIAISGKIANDKKEYLDVSIFHYEKDIVSLVDLIEERVFPLLPNAADECCMECGFTCREMVGKILNGEKKRSDCRTDRNQEILLSVNGKEIKIVPFVQRIFKDMIISFVRNLKGTQKGEIKISINDNE